MKERWPRSESAEMRSVTICISGASLGSAAKTRAAMKTPRNLRIILIFFEPSHLNVLELGFVRFRWIVVKILELDDPFMQIREANVSRIELRELLVKRERDVVKIRPGELLHLSLFLIGSALLNLRPFERGVHGTVHHQFGELLRRLIDLINFGSNKQVIAAMIH